MHQFNENPIFLIEKNFIQSFLHLKNILFSSSKVKTCKHIRKMPEICYFMEKALLLQIEIAIYKMGFNKQ